MNNIKSDLTKMGIHMDIMVERALLIEQIRDMKPEHLWRLHTYIKRIQEIEKGHKLPLPIGVSDYCAAVTSYYYVDKTLMIKDILDERSKVSLFLRPRRFGKTLNMDMLKVFFEKTEQDTSIYFKDKQIWNCGEKYKNHQGKYPLIFVTFKDVKFRTWAQCMESIAELMRIEFDRHGVLLNSLKCSDSEKNYFKNVLYKKMTEVELSNALSELSRMLYKHYGVAPIMIIDEYDTPILQGHVHGFYEDAVQFMRNLFSGGLKDNHHLSYGFLTGILRVAKESIFSGMNNLKVNSILDNRYAEYFGFTTDEIREMCLYYDAHDKYEEIKEWYNGYLFGDENIYNPWSVINYFNNDCKPAPFWVSTSSNEVIHEILAEATEDIYKNLCLLLQGKTISTYIDISVICPQIKENPSSVYSFLLVAGYLKLVTINSCINDNYLCEVALPNKEIACVYNKEILANLTSIIPQSSAIAIQEAIYQKKAELLKSCLTNFLKYSVSYFDTEKELFYHGLLLGLCAVLDNRYFLSSNKEAGDGRYDIALFPRERKLPGIIIEIKVQKRCGVKRLKALAEGALQQIVEKNYDVQFDKLGVKEVLHYGVAFSGKKVEVAEMQLYFNDVYEYT